MKLITRDTDYAVRALAYIARKDPELISTSDLFKELKIPRPFLRKILQILNKKGILTSYKGKGGGFLLAVPAERIYLVDLIEIFQGPFQLNECLFKKRACPSRKTCALRKKIRVIEENVVSEIKVITIASLFRPSGT